MTHDKCIKCGYEPKGRGWLISNPVKCPVCYAPQVSPTDTPEKEEKTLKHLVTGATIGTYSEDCPCQNTHCEHLISDFDKFCEEPITEKWEEELRDYIDKTLKPKKPTISGLDREIIINHVRNLLSLAKAEARKEMAEEIRKGLLAMGAVSINGSEMLVELDKVLAILKTK